MNSPAGEKRRRGSSVLYAFISLYVRDGIGKVAGAEKLKPL